MKRATLVQLIALGGFLGCADSGGKSPDPVAADKLQPSAALFTDITQDSAIDFTHFNATSAERLLPETMGSGVAFFDVDNDGWSDLYFANGAQITESRTPGPTGRLYRNLRNTRFQDVTRGSGLEETFYGMGVAVGDVDNDGWTDLLVTGVDGTRLYRNSGGGRFDNVSSKVNLRCRGFASSAAFLDYDRDGYLDLLVGRYVRWTREEDIACSPDGVNRTYCTPEVYPSITNCLYRNIQGQRFEDVSEESGIAAHSGKALGLAVFDYNQDGWPDVAVANDTAPNFLFVNQRDGTFTEIGTETGMAYSESGAARGGMGIDAGDIDRDGWVDLLIGNFSYEMVAFFRHTPGGFFIDDAAQVGLGIPTLLTLTFGTLLEDFDNDTWLDVLLVNGHIEPEISRTQRSLTYGQPPQFFRNREGEEFSALDSSSQALTSPIVGRGLASADVDRDGDLDFVITQNGGPARLLRNEAWGNNWLQVQLEGTKSNRTGYGARLRVVSEGLELVRDLVSGRSYLSASEPIVTIGLGSSALLDYLEISWPSGLIQRLNDPPINQRLHIKEPNEGQALASGQEAAVKVFNSKGM